MRKVKKCRAARKNYKAICKEKDKVIKQHEQRIKKIRSAMDQYDDDVLELKRDNKFLCKENKNIKKELSKIHEMFLNTYNELQEIDAKRVELVRENNLLHDTLVSYKIPLNKKSWSEIKYQFKSWVKQFDEK